MKKVIIEYKNMCIKTKKSSTATEKIYDELDILQNIECLKMNQLLRACIYGKECTNEDREEINNYIIQHSRR